MCVYVWVRSCVREFISLFVTLSPSLSFSFSHLYLSFPLPLLLSFSFFLSLSLSLSLSPYSLTHSFSFSLCLLSSFSLSKFYHFVCGGIYSSLSLSILFSFYLFFPSSILSFEHTLSFNLSPLYFSFISSIPTLSHTHTGPLSLFLSVFFPLFPYLNFIISFMGGDIFLSFTFSFTFFLSLFLSFLSLFLTRALFHSLPSLFLFLSSPSLSLCPSDSHTQAFFLYPFTARFI